MVAIGVLSRGDQYWLITDFSLSVSTLKQPADLNKKNSFREEVAEKVAWVICNY